MTLYWLFFRSLLLTVLIEGLVMALMFRRRNFVYYSLLCNLLTNPALNLTLLLAVNWIGLPGYWPAFIVGELAVVGVEARILHLLCRFPPARALAVSLLLNLASAATGLLFR